MTDSNHDRTGRRRLRLPPLPLLLLLLPAPGLAASLPDLIERLRPGIVAVGTVQPTRQPRNRMIGTGFAVGKANLVVTNNHVIPATLDGARRETLAVFSGHGKETRRHAAEVLARDEAHDLALLRVTPGGLTPLRLDPSDALREGETVAFTGFPITHVLGLYHATHQGLVAAITPVVIPVDNARGLTARQIDLLRNPYSVLQLDATAYPGNSGSPVYRIDDGQVVGIINSVLLKGTRENALRDPSNISYAIPVRHVRELLARETP